MLNVILFIVQQEVDYDVFNWPGIKNTLSTVVQFQLFYKLIVIQVFTIATSKINELTYYIHISA